VPTAPSSNNAAERLGIDAAAARPTSPYGNDSTAAIVVIHNIGASEPYLRYMGCATLAATA